MMFYEVDIENPGLCFPSSMRESMALTHMLEGRWNVCGNSKCNSAPQGPFD